MAHKNEFGNLPMQLTEQILDGEAGQCTPEICGRHRRDTCYQGAADSILALIMYSGTTRAEKKRRKQIRVIYFAVPDVRDRLKY
jgi:hypothetical protein